MNDNGMLVRALLKDFIFRRSVGSIRMGQIGIPFPPRVDDVIRDDLFGNYLREPRNNALPEGFKITDGITFFDEFEERPKFLLR